MTTKVVTIYQTQDTSDAFINVFFFILAELASTFSK